MKTYVHLLQLHTHLKNISYPSYLIEKAVELPPVLRTDTSNFAETTYSSFWTNLFVQEQDAELGYESNSVQFQIYFFISSMAHLYREPIVQQISRKHLLISQINNNMFLSNKTKEYTQNIFYKTQRDYLALTRFANQVRHKLGKEKIDTDLRMDPIDIKSRFAISLIQNNARYHFVLSDLINIIQTAITNSQNMFPNPLWPKNPYNNLPLDHVQLYNIYFRIKFSYLNVPHWIHLFFTSNFDKERFIIDNEQILREHYIKNHVTNAHVSILCEEIRYMLSLYKRTMTKLEIDPTFPKKDLVNIFRPYLYLYLMGQDAVDGTEKKMVAMLILKHKLFEFAKFNPRFGRKTVKTRFSYVSVVSVDDSNSNPFSMDSEVRRRKYVTTVSYNTVHIPFTMAACYKCFTQKWTPLVFSTGRGRSNERALSQESEESSESDSSEALSETNSNASRHMEAEIEFINSIRVVATEPDSTYYSIFNHLGDLANDSVLHDDNDSVVGYIVQHLNPGA